MQRIRRFLIDSIKQDPLLASLLMLVVVVTVWLLAIPLTAFAAQTAMRRFHLANDSFATWSVQCVVPQMYQFANQYESRWLRPTPPEPAIEVFDLAAEFQVDLDPKPEPEFVRGPRRFLNHYPARRFTFAPARFNLFHESEARWMRLHTAYRGQAVVTDYHFEPIEISQDPPRVRYQVKRLSSTIQPADQEW
ncbi:hypothetical protein SV7mr_08620 [Stieleria bergensis]|uniref:Uncharacterized protein n=1 Tax=Stieleria bergensis TaxID=2528025 RepID=A0A517SQH5_9BACT|nr:hypothetical protein SV7mr_08620 [Planctomycetes bacterium SV_7m_r]